PPPPVPLPATPLWRMPRVTRAEAAVRVTRTLEDTPFYARSLLAVPSAGAAARCLHESLSLERFRRRPLQWLLPFRMRRAPQ
ncbi:MAG: carotenoid 1,2-hydratase, partial [Burkholderiaceae bacterium]|nr:carotenoid 1,2-hydratase [Burkholderiaceae bacterium]